MLSKTILSKILSAAIAAITIVSPLGVSANPTSSQGDEKNNPETTTVSSQETFANRNLTAGKKRKSTEPILPASPGKKIKFKQSNLNPRVIIPYNIEINLSNLESYGYIDFCLDCNFEGTHLTNKHKELMKTFYKELITIAHSKNIKFLGSPYSKQECSLDDIINSNVLFLKTDNSKKPYLAKTLTNIINSICDKMNIKFIKMYLD